MKNKKTINKIASVFTILALMVGGIVSAESIGSRSATGTISPSNTEVIPVPTALTPGMPFVLGRY